MNLIWFFLRTSWLSVAIACFAGLLSGASSARLIALINSTVSSNQPSTTILVWSFAGLILVVLLTSSISQFFLIRLSQRAIFDMRMRLSRRILSSPLRHLEEVGASRLLATLTDDVQSVSGTVFVIPFLCIDLALIVGCLTYLGSLSGAVFLVMLAFLIVAIVSVQLLLNKALHFFSLAREEQDRLFNHFRAITEGTKELKLHRDRCQVFLSEELQSTAAASSRHNVVSLTLFATATNWGQFLFFVAIALLLFGIPSLLSINTQVLSGYILTITYMLLPLQNILRQLPVLGRASVALKKIESLGLSLASRAELETLQPTSLHPATQPDLKPSCQRLELIGVTHAYRGEGEESSFILGPIDLTFHPGELVFIVGGNGSGKSTLAKLITGLYIPEKGEIRVDGQPITDENRDWYRQHFSAVFSDFYLFEKFLGLGSPDLDTRIKDYLIQLQLERKVQVENGVLSTTALSQGQRKRLALLTAYLEDRPIYLFDEWASDQDPLFKELFYTQLLPELRNRGKTVLAISHDDRYFHGGDRVVKLDYGQVEYDKSPDN